MQGKVTAARLNVREKPDPSATKLGILSQNTIIETGYTPELACRGPAV